MSHRDLRVLHAAEGAAVLVNELAERSRRRLIDVAQLQKAAMRVPLNIGEGFGRKSRADRDYKLSVARRGRGGHQVPAGELGLAPHR